MEPVVSLTGVVDKILRWYLHLTHLCGLTVDAQQWTIMPVPTSCFLSLPRELRLRIYHYLFCDKSIEVRCGRKWGESPETHVTILEKDQLRLRNSKTASLLSVCKQIYREAIITYYQCHRVHLGGIETSDIHGIFCHMPHLRWHVQEVEMEWFVVAEMGREDNLHYLQALKSLKRLTVDATDCDGNLKGPKFDTLEDAQAFVADRKKLTSAALDARANFGARSLTLARIEVSRKRHLPKVKINVRFMLDFGIADDRIGTEVVADLDITRDEFLWEHHDQDLTLRQGLIYDTETRKMKIIDGDLRLHLVD